MANQNPTPKTAAAPAQAKPARAKVDPNESKSDKFRRLGGKRMAVALKSLAGVKSLANRGSYDWTDEQGEKIVSALRAEIDALETALKATAQAKATADVFTL